MKEYVSLPPTWRDDLDARNRVERSLDATGKLPVQAPTKREIARGEKR